MVGLLTNPLKSLMARPKLMRLDFTKFDTKKNDGEVYITSADIQRMLGRIFVPSMKIQSFRPDTLRFAYNHGLSRMLPVKLAGKFKAHQQNYIQSIRVEPDSVKVFAPAAILDTMHAAYTEQYLFEGLHEAGSFQVPMRGQKLVKYDPSLVRIKVGVGYYTEKTVVVPVIGLNFPAEKKLRTDTHHSRVVARQIVQFRERKDEVLSRFEFVPLEGDGPIGRQEDALFIHSFTAHLPGCEGS